MRMTPSIDDSERMSAGCRRFQHRKFVIGHHEMVVALGRSPELTDAGWSARTAGVQLASNMRTGMVVNGNAFDPTSYGDL